MPAWSSNDTIYRGYVGQSWQRQPEPQGIAAIHHCVLKICNALLPSRSPWRVVRRTRTKNGVDVLRPLGRMHPVDRLLQNPSKGWTPDRFFTNVLYSYLTLGNVGLRIGRDSNGIPISLWPGMPIPRDFQTRSGQTAFAPIPPRGNMGVVEIVPVDDDDLIRLMWPGGDDEFGPSPLYDFCRFTTNIIFGIERATQKRLTDNATYGAMVKSELELVGKAAANRLYADDTTKELIVSHDVADANNMALVLAPGQSIVYPQNSPVTDENVIPLTHLVLNNIALVYNLPTENLSEPSKFSKSVNEVSAIAYRDCFDPIAKRIASELSLFLLSDRDRANGLQVEIDLTRYQAPSLAEAIELMGKAVGQHGLYSHEEGREFLGLPPPKEGDTFFYPRGTGSEDPQAGGASEPPPDRPEETEEDGA